jgi:hypothetical protein
MNDSNVAQIHRAITQAIKDSVNSVFAANQTLHTRAQLVNFHVDAQLTSQTYDGVIHGTDLTIEKNLFPLPAKASKTLRRRNRDPNSVNLIRRRQLSRIQEVAPDLRVTSGQRKLFVANGKVGCLCPASTKSGPRQDYWLAFKTPVDLIVIGLPGEIDFVVPYARHAYELGKLSRNRDHYVEFYVGEDDGRHYLTGKGLTSPLDIEPYRDSFSLFA